MSQPPREDLAATTRQYQDTHVDVKLVLSALWVAMMLVFAYGDIFGFFRADFLKAALKGEVATMGFAINQGFLIFTMGYILPGALMVILSLVLKPRVNRIVNIVVGLVYLISIIGFCIGETWVYYLLASFVEVVLLAAIVRTAWKWPPPQNAPSLP
jgi:hypothetical protein